jgi:hypothetical protein
MLFPPPCLNISDFRITWPTWGYKKLSVAMSLKKKPEVYAGIKMNRKSNP